MSSLVHVAPASLTRQGRSLEELVPGFLQWFALVRRRLPNTVAGYRHDLQSFLGFCAQAELTAPAAVTFRHVEFYLGWLQTARGLKASSANRHLHCLRTFFQYLVREGIVTTNPAVDTFMLPTQKKLPSYLTVPEQERVLTALSEDTSPLGRRDYALISTALLTGLRCAELAALQVAHVDLEAGRLRVVQGKGNKDRELPIIPRLEAILRPYLEEVRPALLGRPLGYLTRSPVSRYGCGSNQWRSVPSSTPHGKWSLHQKVEGRTVSRTLEARSREEAERQRAELIPLPPPPPFVFINAHVQGSFRVRRAGLALSPKTIFALVRRTVVPILGRPVAPHMLRHSFASRLRENGADLQLMQEALGHANITTTTMYAHLTTNRRRQELARLLE
jgi:site-specific recombinase XerD